MDIINKIKKVISDNAVFFRRLFYNIIPLVLFSLLIGECIGIVAHSRYEKEKMVKIVSRYEITLTDKTDSSSHFTFKIEPWMLEK